jgi:hypothetical protein
MWTQLPRSRDLEEAMQEKTRSAHFQTIPEAAGRSPERAVKTRTDESRQ